MSTVRGFFRQVRHAHRMMAGQVQPHDGIHNPDRDPRVTRVGAFLLGTVPALVTGGAR
jgi:hypothetical protein